MIGSFSDLSYFSVRGRGMQRKMEQQREASAATGPATSSEDSVVCPICLERIEHEAYLDRCFHTFCYRCIANWTKHVSKQHSRPLTSIRCPLCKGENSSIVYGLSGNSFQRHYVNKDPETSGQKLINSDGNAMQLNQSAAGILHRKFNVLLYWKNSRCLRQNQFLQTWLRREIQTLLQEEDVGIIMHHVLGVIDTFFKRQQQDRCKLPPEEKQREFKQLLSDAARPFICDRTDRFVDELELFLASSLNIEAYDKVYMECARMLASAPCEDCTEDEHRPTLGVPMFRCLDEDLDKGF